MFKTIRYALPLLCLALLAACEKEQGAAGAAPEYGSVALANVNYPESYSTTLPATSSSMGMTATCVKALGQGHVAVSYHGRNGEQKGLVQIVRYNERNEMSVISELNTLNARVNCLETDGARTLFIGLDGLRDQCGVAAVVLSQEYRFDTQITQMEPVLLDGVSINCLAFDKGTSLLRCATGAFQAPSKAGFAKLHYTGGRFEVLHRWLNSDLRGRWIDLRGDEALIFYFARPTTFESTAWRQPRVRYYSNITPQNYGRAFTFEATPAISLGLFDAGTDEQAVMKNKNSCRFYTSPAGETYFAVCYDRFELYCMEQRTATLTASVDKGTHAVDFDGSTLYAAHGTAGVFRYRIGDEGTIERTGKWASDRTTESGSASSANYVLCHDGRIFAAYGYAGLVILTDDDF